MPQLQLKLLQLKLPARIVQQQQQPRFQLMDLVLKPHLVLKPRLVLKPQLLLMDPVLKPHQVLNLAQ
jgi:hypothetical protein